MKYRLQVPGLLFPNRDISKNTLYTLIFTSLPLLLSSIKIYFPQSYAITLRYENCDIFLCISTSMLVFKNTL